MPKCNLAFLPTGLPAWSQYHPGPGNLHVSALPALPARSPPPPISPLFAFLNLVTQGAGQFLPSTDKPARSRHLNL